MEYVWKEMSETKNAQRNNQKGKIKINMDNLKTKGARFVVRKQIQRNFHFPSENRRTEAFIVVATVSWSYSCAKYLSLSSTFKGQILKSLATVFCLVLF